MALELRADDARPPAATSPATASCDPEARERVGDGERIAAETVAMPRPEAGPPTTAGSPTWSANSP
nr:hypothetical protein [Streptomyces griseus]